MLTQLNPNKMNNLNFSYYFLTLFVIHNLLFQIHAENILEDGKYLTKEQEEFLRKLAKFDDELWEKETKNLFAKYSQSLSKLSPDSASGGVPKSPKSPQDSSVVVFSLPESSIYTPNGINLTLILETLNRQNKNKAPSGGESSLPVIISSVTEASVDDEETEGILFPNPTTPSPSERIRVDPPAPVQLVAPQEEFHYFPSATSTLRSAILQNSTEIVSDLGNSTESGNRNGTMSTTENHILKQVQKIIDASAQRNISGILDASLGITGNTELTNFVNGIFNIAYCNGVRILLRLC